MKEGIYFNLSNEDYHNDSAVSSSGIKLLLKNPYKFWWNSPMNPKKEKIDTKALRLGRLYHTLLLEPEKFEDEFLVLPKGKLIKSYLKETGLVQEDIEDFNVIREPDLWPAQKAIETMKQEPFYNKYFKDGGYPEVSIFWYEKELDVMCRARFDRLSAVNAIDYKTTADVDDVKKAITNYDYDLSASFYLRSLAQIKAKAVRNEEIHIEGNQDQKDWFNNEFLKSEENFIFRFLFQEKEEPFLTRRTSLACDILDPSNLLFKKALQIYKANMAKWGDKWERPYQEEEEIRATDLPMWWLYKVDEMLDKGVEV